MVAPRVRTGFLRRSPLRRNPASALLLLLALILLGFWLRVHALDAFSFWTDEGLTPARSGYSLAQLLRNEIVIQGVVTRDTHPPLYYLLIALTRRLFGLSDFAFRYPSVLCGVLLIPLLYRLGRLLDGAALGLLVALLATVNPLQVYYSQEARMYSLLALLATAMSTVLWLALRAAGREEARVQSAGEAHAKIAKSAKTAKTDASWRPWRELSSSFLLYVVLAALAVYTHYTAVFLVAAQALLWAWLLWRAGLRRVLAGAAVAGLLLAIPLLPYTLPRLRSGPEANYFAVAPLTVLQDVVRFFHLGLTVDFARPLVKALNWLAFGLLLLGVWAAARPWVFSPAPPRPRAPAPPPSRAPALLRPAFLLLWLLAPPLGLMLGSALFKPMYQGVRHIMAASPAFLLLVGYGVWGLASWLPLGRRARARRRDGLRGGWSLDSDPAALLPWNVEPGAWARPPRAGRANVNPLGIIALVLLLLGAAVSLMNLYTNPAFAKDDFRAIVRFIETRAGGNDAVVYNNAVLLPLHEHYRQRADLDVTALPAYPQPATGQEPELDALAAAYDRLWFVTDPPADGRDDAGLIHAWFDAHLLEVADRNFPARTTVARVVGYATSATTAQGGGGAGAQGGESPCSASPPNDTAGIQPAPLLPGSPAPLRCLRLDRSPLALPTLWVDLWWGGAPPPAGAQIAFTLTGPDGAEYYRRAHPLQRAGVAWDEAAPTRLSYDLPLPPGLPPGAYTLAVAAEGQPAAALGEVAIEPTTAWPASPESLFPAELAVLRRPSSVVFSDALALAAIEPWDDHVLAGGNLPLTLYWRVGPAGVDLASLRYRLEVIGRGGAVLRSQETRPGAPWLGPVAGGALLREVTSLYFRPETPPGTYRLRWTLLDVGQASACPSGQAEACPTVGRPVVEGRVRVLPPEARP